MFERVDGEPAFRGPVHPTPPSIIPGHPKHTMLAPEQFLGFLLAAILLTASPGPDNLMVLGLGMSKGRKQGMVFGLGCALAA